MATAARNPPDIQIIPYNQFLPALLDAVVAEAVDVIWIACVITGDACSAGTVAPICDSVAITMVVGIVLMIAVEGAAEDELVDD